VTAYEAMPGGPEGARCVGLHMLASWMGERFFRTFRVAAEDPAPFDAVLQQRERLIGVTLGVLWDEDAPLPGADDFAEMLTADMANEPGIEDGAYVVWVPPRASLPQEEPARSHLRVMLANGLKGLDAGDRREVRLPVTVGLAKIQDDGAYMSVSGGLSPEWTVLSEGLPGAFHLDSRAICRLPEERAEIDILISRVRDRAAVLRPEEVTDIELHDHWVVSRLPDSAPHGVAVIGAREDLDPLDGTAVRRSFRAHVTRAVEQRRAAQAAGDAPELSVLVVVAALAHMKDELVTASLRGMNPAAYGALDLVALVADAQVRQVLQPRSLPWEQAPASPPR
jgi:hypothetical protein